MDYYGLLLDGVTQGLLYAPVTIAFALLYAHAGEIDISIDAAAIMAGVAFGLLLSNDVGLLSASIGGIAAGALVTLLTGVIHMHLQVPFLVSGLVVSFIMSAWSTYLVGERLSLLNLPRLFVTPPSSIAYLWLPALTAILLALAVAIRRAIRIDVVPGVARARCNAGRFYAAGALAMVVIALLGVQVGERIRSVHIGLVVAVATWLASTAFHRSDRGLADRAIGANASFRLRADWRSIRVSTLLLTGIIAGMTGVLLAQYKAQASGGGSFNIVIGALASYVLFDRPARWAQRRRDSLRVRSAKPHWRVAALSLVANSNPATRAFIGCMVFYVGTQFVIALVRHPELPRLFIGITLLLVLGDWDRLISRSSRLSSTEGANRDQVSNLPVLAVRDLWKAYPRGADVLPVLTGVELTMSARERIVRIRGPNAAGKTTLFRILDGDIEPDRGSCLLNGVDIVSLPRFKRSVFLITQNPFETVATTLTIADNLRLAALQKYRPFLDYRDASGQLGTEVLERYGLSGVITKGLSNGIHALAGSLSGGQAQCLAFAMAAAAEPELILADEPTANLDPQNAELVLNLIESVSRNFPILIIAHDERVARIADATHVLVDGRMRWDNARGPAVGLYPTAVLEQ